MNNLDHLNWRYATKKFDPSKKISGKELQEILEVLRLAPSSFGLQPWKFLIITNSELRKKLQPHSWNQPQVVQASHLVVLCSLETVDEVHVKTFIRHSAAERGVTEESLAGYERMILDFLKKMTPEKIHQWMDNQIYLALGILLAECAHRRIDTCPMEGFDAAKYDELLGLKSQGLRTVVLCPIGYRAADDTYAGLKKIRFKAEEIIRHL